MNAADDYGPEYEAERISIASAAALAEDGIDEIPPGAYLLFVERRDGVRFNIVCAALCDVLQLVKDSCPDFVRVKVGAGEDGDTIEQLLLPSTLQ